MFLFDDGKRLEKAVGEEAAQVIASILERMSEEQKQASATKGDLRETELRLQKEIEVVRKDMQQIKYDLLKWQFAIGFALVAVMAKGFGWLGF